MGHRGRTCGAGGRRRPRHRLSKASRSATASRVSSNGNFIARGRASSESAAARTADYARLVAVPAIWGGTFVGRQASWSPSLSPLMGSFARYVIACVALLVAAFVLEGGLPRLTRHAVGWPRSCSALFGVFAYNLFFMGALEQTARQPRRADHRAQSGRSPSRSRRWCSRSG